MSVKLYRLYERSNLTTSPDLPVLDSALFELINHRGAEYGLLADAINGAAGLATDRITACSTARVAPATIERLLALSPPAPPPAVGPMIVPLYSVGPRTSWKQWLAQILVSTRRSWLCLAIYTARRPNWRWAGPLAVAYLGSVRRTHLLDDATLELQAVLAELQSASPGPDGPDGTLAPLLQGIAYLASGTRDDVVNHLRQHHGFVSSQARPNLARAIRDAIRTIQADTKRAIHGALPDLENETPPPPAPLPRQDTPLPANLNGWLASLPCDFEDEEVGNCIFLLRHHYPERAPASGEEVLPVSDLSAWLYGYTEPDSLHHTIIASFAAGEDIYSILAGLHPQLPAPNTLPRDRIEQMMRRLREWTTFFTGWLANPVAGPDSTYAVFPLAIRSNPGFLPAISAATTTANHWVGASPTAWPPAGPLSELALRAALLSLCLDDLAELLWRRYRNRFGLVM